MAQPRFGLVPKALLEILGHVFEPRANGAGDCIARARNDQDIDGITTRRKDVLSVHSRAEAQPLDVLGDRQAQPGAVFGLELVKPTPADDGVCGLPRPFEWSPAEPRKGTDTEHLSTAEHARREREMRQEPELPSHFKDATRACEIGPEGTGRAGTAGQRCS